MTAAPKSHALLEVYAPGLDTSHVVYSENFAAGTGGWTAGAGSTVSNPSGRLQVAPSGGVGDATASRAITGLTVGEVYTIAIDIVGAILSGRFAFAELSVTGIAGLSTSPWIEGTGTGSLRHTFRATATSHTVVIGVHRETMRFDNVTICLETPLNFKSGSLTLDVAHAPYATATLTIANPGTLLELLDPRDGGRLFCTASLSWDEPVGLTAQARDFDLLLHERSYSPSEDTATLIGQSDEAKLIDAAQMEQPSDTDQDPRLYQDSLRGIVNCILGRHGGYLQASPSDDADFTITRNVTNLITNPSAEVNTTGAVSSTTNATLARSTAQQYVGTACYSSTAIAAGSTGLWFGGGSAAALTAYCPVVEGTYYWFTAYVRTSVTRDVQVRIRWFTNASTPMSSALDSTGTVTSVVAGAWTRLTVRAPAPAGATFAAGGVGGTSFATGNVLYVDAVMFHESWTDWSSSATNTPIAYFDGTGGADTHYSYAWTGTAHASTSTRTRLDNRDINLLLQDIGRTDWDFLEGLLNEAGLQLFCDELARWYLVDPDTYTPAGTTTAQEAVNLADATDTITLERTRIDGTPLWASGVVIRYTSVDPDTNEPVIRTATAGTRQKVAVLERSDRRYAGTGDATRWLAAAQARGRVQELTALADLGATPGQVLETSVPGVPDQEGYVSAVTWSWAAEGDQHDIMQITARDLVDA